MFSDDVFDIFLLHATVLVVPESWVCHWLYVTLCHCTWTSWNLMNPWNDPKYACCIPKDLYKILRAMLCQEIGSAQGTEEILSGCLWTWLCKGYNSKCWQTTRGWDACSHLKSSENAGDWSSRISAWKSQILSQILWSHFRICSLHIWCRWPLAPTLYLSPIDTLAIGSICAMWIYYGWNNLGTFGAEWLSINKFSELTWADL